MIIGLFNIAAFLIGKGKWRTLPLALIYLSAQITLIFGLARTAYTYQPYFNLQTTPFETYLYL